MTDLFIHDSAARTTRRFEPIDPNHVRMYVCGPTVYDLAHLGNARPVVVFDVLARLLRRIYPRVTYVRNITDVDDKINARSRESGEPIGAITARTTEDFHRDMAALGALPPDVEPRATQHIAEMIALIERLIANGHAYAADGHVLFSVPSFADYGKLSGRSPDELLAGARVDVAPYKRDAGDFVLWKPSDDATPGWDSPWGRGRPGWHIECSAMSWKHLGEEFDIHGGGHDLIFPHHENEVAQSVCAFPGHGFAHYWMHNGMLLVDGEKMSKSLGNFMTVRDILDKGWRFGEAFRLLLLRTHYRQALDFTMAGLEEAKAELDDHYAMLSRAPAAPGGGIASQLADWAVAPLLDDLNTPLALARLRDLRTLENAVTVGGSPAVAMERARLTVPPAPGVAAKAFREAAGVLGVAAWNADDWLKGRAPRADAAVPGAMLSAQVSHLQGQAVASGQHDEEADIDAAIAARLAARKAKNWAEADRIRDELKAQGIVLEDGPAGTTWRRA
ncbi:cysteine--tRNA ligase [Roseomonas eburnea]|uniref:Cysteine--tRNA ligase n=1 Tax=Neoroseomonas eburnea TaxID=1346889 RepID=A0A9X9X998_9PROT|nr:cysteine--tRNA ligase [Neoroseomonas eburnea]MBR0680284.1 cysteine--tRNA ligase [Neoroseomonas eburnea]